MNRAKAMTLIGLSLLGVVGILASILIWKKVGVAGGEKPTLQSSESLPNIQSPIFAEFSEDQTAFTASLPSTSISLNELSNLTNFEKEDQPFEVTQKKYLIENAFLTIPNKEKFYSDNPEDPVQRSDDWTGLYQKIGGGAIFSRAPENSVFISSDYLLHVYHRLLEKEVEYIEQTVFVDKLTSLSKELFTLSVASRKNAQTESDQASFDRLTAYFAVPTAILETVRADVANQIVGDSVDDNILNAQKKLDDLKPQMSTGAYQIAQQELKLIFDHQQLATPPLFAEPNTSESLSITEDYTQYTPRSHYAKNAMLRAYFRAMMWYGRTNFLSKSATLTRDALHIAQLMKDENRLTLWGEIYNPTAFLVGQSDDLGIAQYQQVLQKAEITSWDLTDRQLQNSQLLIGLLPKPKVMGAAVFDPSVLNMTKEQLQNSTQGFRLFGQRFTPDAFIFTTVTQGQELPDAVTGESLPSNTTSLLVMSAIGNPTADLFLPEWMAQNAPNSQRVLNNRLSSLKTQFSNLPTSEWTQNLYWSWLYTLRPLFTDTQSLNGYPTFMRSPNWNVKNLQTALGSWTELKHDTLLYAKQSYAEMGAGGDEKIPPVPKGYVEPNIEFLDRILALSRMTKNGLEKTGTLPQEFAGRHETFEGTVEFFRNIAVKQLANEKITDDDFEKLRTIGGYLDSVVRPLPNEQSIEGNARAALIADVHTDVPNSSILYEATGIPDFIYVAIKDANGTRLTKGLVYTHYEFNGPLGNRETDQTWQQKNYPPNNLPERPFWVRGLTPQ